MQNYLVAYYRGVKPTFTYAETLDDARSCAISLLARQQNNLNDILSIVEVATDRVVFYSTGKKIVAKLNTLGQPARTGRLSGVSLIKSLLNWMNLKLAKLTVQ